MFTILWTWHNIILVRSGSLRPLLYGCKPKVAVAQQNMFMLINGWTFYILEKIWRFPLIMVVSYILIYS